MVVEFGANFQFKSKNEFGVVIKEDENIEKTENEVDFNFHMLQLGIIYLS